MADIYAHTVTAIDGSPTPLEKFRGQVTLVVNVASQCGYTRQYQGLQELHTRLAGRPFAVLAFPSNDFGAQEPGTEAEIQAFCTSRFGVSFPMFAKVPVKGAGCAPLYAALTEAAGAPAWNFHKYLVGRDGKVLQAFPSRVEPTSPELIQAIERALS